MDMSDDPMKGNEHDDASAGNEPNIKALREAAEQGKKERAERERLERELAFTKAGIDTDSKLGKMLVQTWQGDLDVEALKAEWAELNPSAGAATTTQVPEDAPTPPGFQDPAGQQQHREQTAGGASAGDQPKATPNPIDLAYERFHGSPSLPLDERQEGAMATVLEAFFNGDKRVMFDRNAHRERALRAAETDAG